MAEIAVRAAGSDANVTVDAAGPETYTFNDLVRLLAAAIGSQARIIHLPSSLALAITQLVGFALGSEDDYAEGRCAEPIGDSQDVEA